MGRDVSKLEWQWPIPQELLPRFTEYEVGKSIEWHYGM